LSGGAPYDRPGGVTPSPSVAKEFSQRKEGICDSLPAPAQSSGNISSRPFTVRFPLHVCVCRPGGMSLESKRNDEQIDGPNGKRPARVKRTDEPLKKERVGRLWQPGGCIRIPDSGTGKLKPISCASGACLISFWKNEPGGSFLRSTGPDANVSRGAFNESASPVLGGGAGVCHSLLQPFREGNEGEARVFPAPLITVHIQKSSQKCVQEHRATGVDGDMTKRETRGLRPKVLRACSSGGGKRFITNRVIRKRVEPKE